MDKQVDFIVTARKWRPLRFGDIIGQKHITTTLLNTLKADRIHHAYLFSGPRGVGKTTAARILARAINCQSPVDSEPDNSCAVCISILESRSLDIIEIDGASNNSVDDVRKLRENAKYPPISGKYKVYIIDEVHMLSTSAFNALLKTLEEPPPHLLFVFATTEIHKVPATIISRCQRLDFKRIEIEDIVNQIKKIAERESISIDEESLYNIAKKADGSMRDAQSIYDQAVAFCGENVTFEVLAEALNLIDQEFFFRISTAIAERRIEEMFDISRDVIAKGFDLMECLHGLLEHFRNILTIKVTGDSKLINSPQIFLEKYKSEAIRFSQADILRILNHISSAIQGFRYSSQPGIKFELTLVQLASFDKTIELSNLLNELENIKKNLLDINSVQVKSSIQDTKPLLSNEDKVEFRTALNRDSFESQSSAKKSENSEPYSLQNEGGEFNKINTSELKSNVSSEELKRGWNEFIRQYGNGGYGLSLLKHLKPDFFDSEIIFYSENQFTTENLNQKNNVINKFLISHYGCKVQWKIITSENSHSEYQSTNIDEAESYNNLIENKLNELQSSQGKEIVSNDKTNKHPVEKALVELFGAEKVM